MTQQDWDNLRKEWLESFRTSHPTPSEEYESKHQHQLESSGVLHKYLRKVAGGTPKAKFFLTEDGIAGNFGFWCPKSAIISDNGSEVEVAEWCKITIVEYYWG